jgi:membrane protease YdiL (CAAX protease family)
LHGLRNRFGPVALCLVVGLVFGIFHFSLFRIFPTAFLGVCFAAATLLTRSIYPAMVWHALNNLLALAIAEAGFEATDLPPWSFAVGAIGLAIAFAMFRRRG